MSEVTYYFNAYDTVTEKWETTPQYMVDGDTGTYAATSSDGAIQKLTGNDCPGTDLGTITKVELRFYGYNDADDETIIRAIFAGGDGSNHVVVPGTTPAWQAYIDITADTNAPSWTWAAVVALDCDVEKNNVAKGNTNHVSRVEILVTYTPYPSPPTSLASPSQTDTTIDLTWTTGANADKTLIRFRDDQYPTGVTDGYQAYFDTGVSVTVSGTPTSLIQELNNSYLAIGITYFRLGQRINAFPVANISRLSFLLYKLGLPTGTAYIRIRKVSDDAILGTIAEVDVSTLTTDTAGAWYDYDCDVDNLTAQDLRFTVEYAGGDGSNQIRMRYQNTDVIAVALTYYTTSWGDSPTSDATIKIYYSIPLTPSTTYYFRAWGYQTATELYSSTTADLTQATSGAGSPTLNAYNQILYTSEPPTPNAWNQVKQEAGTGWKPLLYV